MPKPVSKTLSMKQPIETIKQLVVFLLPHKILFSKRFELNQLWIQTKSELTNSNYPITHPTKLQSTFKQSMEIWSHQSSSSTHSPQASSLAELTCTDD